MTTFRPTVREPKQDRSREAWERVLETGLALLEEGGVEALTITEVCRRSRISPPSLYARVDGRAGLFAAVWERGILRLRATEDRLLADLPRPGAGIAERARDAAEAIATIFAEHRAFLRPVIGHATTSPDLLRGGAAESRRLLDRLAATLGVDPDTGIEIAQALYAECVLRTMYGAEFFTGAAESEEGFRARIARAAVARARA